MTYTESNAIPAWSSRLQVWDGAEYQDVIDFDSINPGLENGLQETSAMGTKMKKFKPTDQQLTPLSFSLFFNFDDVVHMRLWSVCRNQTREKFRFYFPKAAPDENLEFYAWTRGLNFDEKHDDVQRANVTIVPDGDPITEPS